MSRTIDTSKRIINHPSHPPTILAKYGLNADNVMLILDALVNGEIRFKVKTYTQAEILALTDVEPGEVFYASDTDMFIGRTKNGFTIWGQGE